LTTAQLNQIIQATDEDDRLSKLSMDVKAIKAESHELSSINIYSKKPSWQHWLGWGTNPQNDASHGFHEQVKNKFD
jgi:hypothetical protein